MNAAPIKMPKRNCALTRHTAGIHEDDRASLGGEGKCASFHRLWALHVEQNWRAQRLLLLEIYGSRHPQAGQ